MSTCYELVKATVIFLVFLYSTTLASSLFEVPRNPAGFSLFTTAMLSDTALTGEPVTFAPIDASGVGDRKALR